MNFLKASVLLLLFNEASEQPPQPTQRCRSLRKSCGRTITLAAEPSEAMRMSKLKSKARRTFRLAISIWFLQANSWRMAEVRRWRDMCLQCHASLHPSRLHPGNSIQLTNCRKKSATTPTTCTPRRLNKVSPPPSWPTGQPSAWTPWPWGLNQVSFLLTGK